MELFSEKKARKEELKKNEEAILKFVKIATAKCGNNNNLSEK